MKILSIGNSFSHDAHRWLHALAGREGIDMETVNLYIGGCTLETHRNNLFANAGSYEYLLNGETVLRKSSIPDALAEGGWNGITLQQASPYSGITSSYEPYLTELVTYIRVHNPGAKLWFHKTWAYEIDCTSPAFEAYGRNQKTMFARITEAENMVIERHGLPIIPVGDVIQSLREEVPEFNYAQGGLSLCRDAFHLSETYGSFAAAATWIVTLTGKPLGKGEFHDFDVHLLDKITEVVNRVCLPAD